MKINVKEFDVPMSFGNNGITLDVRDNDDKYLGDLRLGRATIEWCKGKTEAGKGVKMRWPDLISFFETVE